MSLQDTDLLLVNRDDQSYTATVADFKNSFTGEITTSPTITATSEYSPSTLTATAADVARATKDTTYINWYRDGSPIAGTQDTQEYTAYINGVYKYEERWVDNQDNVFLPSAEVTVSSPVIATPIILSPANGTDGVDADTHVFTSNVPTASGGSISSWNQALWLLTRLSDFNTFTASKSIVPNSNQQLNANEISGLEAGESYQIQVTYSANDPGVADVTSSPITPLQQLYLQAGLEVI